MSNIQEWLKGISFSIFGAIMFYFLWNNVFSNILNYVVGENTIIGAFAWVSFVLLFLFTVPIYLVYTGITGSGNKTKTEPIELLKAIAIWSIMMPFLIVIFLVVDSMVTALNDSNILDAELQGTASMFSWFLALVCTIGMTAFPFYYVLKGYGQFKKGDSNNG